MHITILNDVYGESMLQFIYIYNSLFVFYPFILNDESLEFQTYCLTLTISTTVNSNKVIYTAINFVYVITRE